MRLPTICTIAALALSAAGASAQDCSDPQTQLAMNECAYLDYLAADEQLNAEYRHARAVVDDSVAEKLRQAQRAWIDFRDKACEAEGALYEGGSIRPMVVSLCLERLTRQRTDDLQLLSGPS